ncbi:MAG: hypothetical protein WC915_02905 [archaeon]|jgi:hypothetical protein
MQLPKFKGAEKDVLLESLNWVKQNLVRTKTKITPKTMVGNRTIAQILESKKAYNCLEECVVLGEILKHNGFAPTILTFHTLTNGIGSGTHEMLLIERNGKKFTVDVQTKKIHLGEFFKEFNYMKDKVSVKRIPFHKTNFPKDSMNLNAFQLSGFNGLFDFYARSNLSLHGSVKFLLKKAKNKVKLIPKTSKHI